MESTFLVTLVSEYEITPLSVERVLRRGFPTSVEEVTIGKIATVTSVVNSMSGEITLPDGGVYLAFSDEIEAVEQGRSVDAPQAVA